MVQNCQVFIVRSTILYIVCMTWYQHLPQFGPTGTQIKIATDFFLFLFLHSELRKYRVCFTEILFIFLMVKENTSRKFSNTFTSLIQTDNMCWIPLQSYLRIFLPRVGENKLKFLSESLSPIFPNVEKTTKSTCFVGTLLLQGNNQG